MAATSFREKEPDRVLVYMFPASAFDLLRGASLGHGHRQHLLPQPPPLFSRPPHEPTPVSPSLKGQLSLSLLLPLLWNLPERCPQASWCQPLPRALLISSPLAVLLASQSSQSQKLESTHCPSFNFWLFGLFLEKSFLSRTPAGSLLSNVPQAGPGPTRASVSLSLTRVEAAETPNPSWVTPSSNTGNLRGKCMQMDMQKGISGIYGWP